MPHVGTVFGDMPQLISEASQIYIATGELLNDLQPLKRVGSGSPKLNLIPNVPVTDQMCLGIVARGCLYLGP
jgi:hypothetical protein